MAEPGRFRDLPLWVQREAYHTLRFAAVLLLGTTVFCSVIFLLEGRLGDILGIAAAMGFVLLLVYLCMYFYWPWAMRSFRQRQLRKIGARRGPAAAQAEAATPPSKLTPADFMPLPPEITPAEFMELHRYFHIFIEVVLGAFVVLLFSVIVVGIVTAILSPRSTIESDALLISIFAVGWVILPFTAHHWRRRRRHVNDRAATWAKIR
jgi:Ca2+/Na+ antiporter